MFGLFSKFNDKKRKGSCRGSILVIEDNEVDKVFIQNVLRKADFEVVAVENSRQGIAMAKQKLPDVIVLDYFLPDLSGLEVCRILKGNPGTKSIAIVFLTVAEDGYTLLECYEAGAHTFLNKPIRAKELIREVELTLQ
ncbi:MAG: response regulator, partial [Candidatus Omnitrophica bacterium]|nr:response regulator [Candidatus Omnitrophota bacterium]